MNTSRSTFRSLSTLIKYNKIEFNNGNPYNLRWQYKWKHAYYTYPKDTYEQTFVRKPEDSPTANYPWVNYLQDICYRILPVSKMYWNRRRRIMDPFQIYVLPSVSFFFFVFFDAALGYKMMTFLPLMMFYTRMRDRCLDPDVKELFLRDMIHQNPELAQLFKPETIHVLDYDLEYDEGIPDENRFPEYKSKLWRFFNSDGGFCTGFFKFGDLESGATMHLKFKTMPIKGPYRYQVGEPFYYYSMIAEVSHNGTVKEIVLADENVELKKHRPFLFLV